MGPPRTPRSEEEPDDSALEPWEDAEAEQRQEANLIARKSWRELAQFYLSRADAAKDPMLRAEALTRLAELMEDELDDPSGAARIYREIVSLTGDRDALKEQVRLLGQRGDPALVRRALDEAVQSARTPKARAAAYLTRAERALEVGEAAQAKADFETAEALTPGMLLVLAGLVRCVSNAERALMAQRLRSALSAAPRRSPDRLDALRVLASVAEESLKDAKLAQWAWTEVLAEEPGEAHARARLLELARTLKDGAALSQLLREQLTREPRGPAARQARHGAGGHAGGRGRHGRRAHRAAPGGALRARPQGGLAAAGRSPHRVRADWRGGLGHGARRHRHGGRDRAPARLGPAGQLLPTRCSRIPLARRLYRGARRTCGCALQETTAPPVPEPARHPSSYREGRHPHPGARCRRRRTWT